MNKLYKKGLFTELEEMNNKGKESLVLLGCGGDPEEWINGVTGMLQEENILEENTCFEQAIITKTTEGRTDITLPFPKNGLNVGALAMWRLRFGDASWLSDFIVNYRTHYGFDELENDICEEEE